MAMKKPQEEKVEVDMVPLIDIISLLLMFLVMVGETAKTASAVHMQLPRASQAASEKVIGLNTEGRIVVQLKPIEGGKYKAVIDNNSFDLVAGGINKTLNKYLTEQIEGRLKKSIIKEDAKGGIPIPVKLRIPHDAPMKEVERVVLELAKVKLVDIHYAADPSKN